MWGAIELKELLLLLVKNDHKDVEVAQDTQLNCLLEQRPLALRVSGHPLFVVSDVCDVVRWALWLWHVYLL